MLIPKHELLSETSKYLQLMSLSNRYLDGAGKCLCSETIDSITGFDKLNKLK